MESHGCMTRIVQNSNSLRIRTPPDLVTATVAVAIAVAVGVPVAMAIGIPVDLGLLFNLEIALEVTVQNAPVGGLRTRRDIRRRTGGEEVDRLERQHVDLGRHDREVLDASLVISDEYGTKLTLWVRPNECHRTMLQSQYSPSISCPETYSSDSTLSPRWTQERMPLALPLLWFV